MYLIIVFLLFLLLLVRLYPLAILPMFDQVATYFEERDRRKRDRFLVELHERIAAMKAELAEAGISPHCRQTLLAACDAYERDLRDEVLRESRELA